MATINGYTAEHMDEIKDATINGASIPTTGVNTGKLIFTKYDGSTLNVGNVIGPQGPIGNTGPQGPAGTNGTNGTGLIVCTSTTRPASPTVGQNIYETDTGKHLVYYGATTLWRQPWNMPWGQVGYGTSTTDNTPSTSAQTSIGLSTTSMTLLTNRLYEINYTSTIFAFSAPTQTLTFELWNASAKVVSLHSISPTGSQYFVSSGVAYTNVSTSTPTWSVRCMSTGGGGVTIKNTVSPAWLTVKDIGPLTSTPPAA